MSVKYTDIGQMVWYDRYNMDMCTAERNVTGGEVKKGGIMSMTNSEVIIYYNYCQNVFT